MKVLRDLDWEPIGYLTDSEIFQGSVVLFRNKKWEDITALNVVKYIDTAADIVYFIDAQRGTVSCSGFSKPVSLKSFQRDGSWLLDWPALFKSAKENKYKKKIRDVRKHR